MIASARDYMDGELLTIQMVSQVKYKTLGSAHFTLSNNAENSPFSVVHDGDTIAPLVMTPKPRVLILTTSYLPLIGGSELAIRHIAQRLPQYDFDLITGKYSPDAPAVEQMDRVRVFCVGGWVLKLRFLLPKNFLPIPMAWQAWRLTLRHRYEMVHAYQASQAGGAAWLLKFVRPSMPFLLTLQEGKELDRQPGLMRWFRSLVLRRADRITAISSSLVAYAKRFTQAPVDLIPNGVDIREVRHASLNPDPTILTVSRLVPKNNVENLIRALPVVRRTIPNARLAIAGDGHLRPALEHLADELGVREHVGFLGTVPPDELPDVYAIADVFVRPSLSEGLGNAFLEAMAAGVPVVGSAVGGIPDFLHEGETGSVCDPHDLEDIARAIIRVLTDEGLRERITHNGAVLVRARYDWNTIARSMAEVYRSLSRNV
jgi:glycosyltransferase involved in cell wall biosynthesis